MTRALVTGASGFLGAGLARSLLASGHDVHLWTRPGSDRFRLRGLEAPVVEVELRDEARTAEALRSLRPEWLFHLAAHGAYPGQRDWRRMVATNVVALRGLLEASIQADVSSFVHAGSSSEYGFTDHAPGEDETPHPNSDYALTKLSATRLCRAFARRHGRRIVTLRLYSVYGPWEAPERLVPTLAVRGLEGRLPPLVSPDVARDFVYLDDALEAFVLAASAGAVAPGTIYNVGTGRQVTIREAVEIARRVLDLAEAPEWGSMPPRSWDTSTWVADPSRIERELGFRATVGFEEGFDRFLTWMREDPERLELYRSRIAAKDR